MGGENNPKKPLTSGELLGKFVRMIEEQAAEMRFGLLEMEIEIEIHDGQIKGIDYSEKRRRLKMRV